MVYKTGLLTSLKNSVTKWVLLLFAVLVIAALTILSKVESLVRESTVKERVQIFWYHTSLRLRYLKRQLRTRL
jgi:hypothetical protein